MSQMWLNCDVRDRRPKHDAVPQGFGTLLRTLRRARKLGLVELGHAVDMDHSLLSRIERGERLPPDIPGLLRLAQALGVPESSDQFADMLALADQARNPALHNMALKMRGGAPWNPFSADLMNEAPPVQVASLAELVSRATEYAITNEATSITIRSASGAVQKFQVLLEPKSKHSKVRRHEVK
jgi:transcriptional regulator with XRE-family HTH domain